MHIYIYLSIYLSIYLYIKRDSWQGQREKQTDVERERDSESQRQRGAQTDSSWERKGDWDQLGGAVAVSLLQRDAAPIGIRVSVSGFGCGL